MKKQTGIWIDGSKSIIVTLFDGNEFVKEIQSEIENRVHHRHDSIKGSFKGSHHVNKEKKIEERKKHQIENFLSKIVDQVKHDHEIFVFGPGELKQYLKKRIEKEDQLFDKLLTVQTTDSMTINQVVARVKAYYKNTAKQSFD